MKQDHLGNNLHVRAVDKFNRVSLPVEIIDYLRAKEELILNADKKSDRDDLCILFAPSNLGFLINHFSSHVGLTIRAGWAEKRKKIGSPTKQLRADNYVCANCDDLHLNKNSVQLPKIFLKFAGISDYEKGEKREVVVRRFEYGDLRIKGFVQIVEKDVWNKRFPEHAL